MNDAVIKAALLLRQYADAYIDVLIVARANQRIGAPSLADDARIRAAANNYEEARAAFRKTLTGESNG